MHQYSSLVDDEKPAQRGAKSFNEYAVFAGNILCKIRYQGIIDTLYAALFPRSVRPSLVRKVRVDRNADDFSIAFAELANAICERIDLGGTHERKIEGVKKQDYFLTFVLT